MQITPPVTVGTYDVHYTVTCTSTSQGTSDVRFTAQFPGWEITPPVGYTDEDFLALADTFAESVRAYIDGLSDITGTPVLKRHYKGIYETAPETL